MYVNKCTKCGREFETKNPKRVICPDCLYPDKKMIISSPSEETPTTQSNVENVEQTPAQSNAQAEEKQQFYSSYSTPDSNEQRFNRPQGGFNRDNRGGFNQNRPQGGYNRDGGGFNQNHPQGGYNRDGGGFNQNRPQGGYNRDGGFNQNRPQGGFNREGGFNQNRPQGGFNRDGGFNQNRPQGGFNQNRPQGGFNQNRPQGGGFNRDNRGGFNQNRPQGGFNRGGFNNRPQGGPGRFNNNQRAPKQLLISREQLEQIELLYKMMLPLPNPDAHETIGERIELEPRKVFFGINLIRQKMMLPKLPFPKRKLAISPDQLFAIKNLYEPLLPLPPIGCHKIIASQLKMDEWRVHVGIGLVRSQMGLDRWNQEREDCPVEFKKQAEEATEKTAKPKAKKAEKIEKPLVEEPLTVAEKPKRGRPKKSDVEKAEAEKIEE